jgi:hypothetical protein
MIRIVLVAVWIFFTISGFSQNQPNPFDLKFRPAKSKTSVPPKNGVDTFIKKEVKEPVTIEKITPPGSSSGFKADSLTSGNPFEVGKATKLDSTIAATPQIDSAPVINPSLPIKGMAKGTQIFFLLLSLLFLIFIVNVDRSFVRDLWRVISNENYSSLHLRNQRNTMRQILLMMGYIIFIFQVGMFLFHVLSVFGYQGRLFRSIWICMALVLAIYLVRHISIRYFRWLFNNEKEMTLYGFDISIFNTMVGLILLPINVLLNFGPETLTKPLIMIGLLMILLAYLMRQLRWMFTARRLIANSLFLFFIYLCAVEILPLLAISKFFW